MCDIYSKEYNNSISNDMEKATWKRIEKNSSKPCPRWGHACCVINDEILFFGGYADSNYMNDLWTYHTTQRVWTEVTTTGSKPSHRSNCSLSFDPTTNSVVVFGGGGPNKQRFNNVSVLNWSTKVWTELTPASNEPAPWERTYHVAELKYPYLVVFGGQGLADLDDLWVFNMQQRKWSEVRFDNDAVRPCARRFHSSCMLGNQFFVIAGCHSKYRCLSDVYSLDLTPLLTTGSTKSLKWNEKKLKGASFLSRWGHSSSVFDGKIYVFAGRFSSDLNDVLVIDTQNNSLKGLKIAGNVTDHPKPRRRHCSAFVGSCMIVFGGFNGEYFNDLHFINVLDSKPKVDINQEQKFSKLIDNHELSDHKITTVDGQTIPIHTPLMARYFKSEEDFAECLQAMDGKYSRKDLINILTPFYKGFGNITDKTLLQYGVKFPESLNRRWLLNPLLQEEPNESNALAIAHTNNEKSTEWVIPLKQHQFNRVILNRRTQWQLDEQILFGQTSIPVSKGLLMLHSPYFRHLFSKTYINQSASLPLPRDCSPIVLELLLSGLMLGAMPIPKDYSLEGWMELLEVAQYLCLEDIKNICEMYLCGRVGEESVHVLSAFAQKMGLSQLGTQCGTFWVRSGRTQTTVYGSKQLQEWFRLQLSHSEQKMIKIGKSAKGRESSCEEKENNRECSNV